MAGTKRVLRKQDDVAPKMASGKIELRAIEDVVPYANNAKDHPDKQVDQIIASIKEFGWTIPILVAEDGTVIAGHGRLLAARKMGLQKVPVIVAKGMSDEQRRAYTIADNRLTEGGRWDREKLALEIGDLKALEFDISTLGFSKAQVDRMFDNKEGNSGSIGEIKYSVVIDCEDEHDQAELIERLEGEGLKCRALML